MSDLKVRRVDAKGIVNKSSLPVGGYSVNPYSGCPHACRYCYASFMKRFDGRPDPWGTYVDVKYWPRIRDPSRYANERIVIGSVTDGYNPCEEEYGRTRAVLEQLERSGAKILICTKSDLVLRDVDILRQMGDVTVSFSINTLDEGFREDMDRAVSIERRIAAMRALHAAGIRTVCFVAPIFPGITKVVPIIERVRDFCDLVWLENLNLRGPFKADIMGYISERRPDLVPLYEEIYDRRQREYWRELDAEVRRYTSENGMRYIDNYLPDGRSEPGRPVVVNYFFHEEVVGSENTGRRR